MWPGPSYGRGGVRSSGTRRFARSSSGFPVFRWGPIQANVHSTIQRRYGTVKSLESSGLYDFQNRCQAWRVSDGRMLGLIKVGLTDLAYEQPSWAVSILRPTTTFVPATPPGAPYAPDQMHNQTPPPIVMPDSRPECRAPPTQLCPKPDFECQTRKGQKAVECLLEKEPLRIALGQYCGQAAQMTVV